MVDTARMSLTKPSHKPQADPAPGFGGSGATTSPSERPGEAPVPAAPPVARFHNLQVVQLALAAHPRQALATAAALAAAAALSGRRTQEVGLVLVTALVGQTILGWHNDLVDRNRDRLGDTPRKPVAAGRLEPGSLAFALACGILLVIPLAIANGVTAGAAYLVALVLGLLANLVLRKGVLSWLPWAAQFAVYPAFLSYGGWGGATTGTAPEILMCVFAALLGVGVHFLRALPDLVRDNRDGYRHLPLRVALRTGAPRLLLLSSVFTATALVGIALTGLSVGLAQ